jgi:hypothetical protein
MPHRVMTRCGKQHDANIRILNENKTGPIKQKKWRTLQRTLTGI